MRYAQHRSQFSSKKQSDGPGKAIFAIAFLLILALVIIGALIFGGGDKASEPGEDQQDQELTTEDQDEPKVVVVKAEPEEGQEPEEAPSEPDPGPQEPEPSVEVTLPVEEISLQDVEGSGGYGTARRGITGDLFTLAAVATLPEINQSIHAYEVWLIKPGVTEFFSAGDMFYRSDGKWGLVWEEGYNAYSEILDYSKIIITRESRDGNEAPSPTHIVEGEF